MLGNVQSKITGYILECTEVDDKMVRHVTSD